MPHLPGPGCSSHQELGAGWALKRNTPLIITSLCVCIVHILTFLVIVIIQAKLQEEGIIKRRQIKASGLPWRTFETLWDLKSQRVQISSSLSLLRRSCRPSSPDQHSLLLHGPWISDQSPHQAAEKEINLVAGAFLARLALIVYHEVGLELFQVFDEGLVLRSARGGTKNAFIFAGHGSTTPSHNAHTLHTYTQSSAPLEDFYGNDDPVPTHRGFGSCRWRHCTRFSFLSGKREGKASSSRREADRCLEAVRRDFQDNGQHLQLQDRPQNHAKADERDCKGKTALASWSAMLAKSCWLFV